MRGKRRILYISGVLSILCLWPGRGAGQLPPQELQPRLVSLGGEMAIEKALDLLHKQTGNTVVDRRKIKAGDNIKLKMDKVRFWEGLDAIAKSAGAGIALYEGNGQIALVDRPTRSLATVYSQLFRVAVKQLSVSRDADNEKPLLTASMEIAWEPRFQPFLLSIAALQAEYAQDAAKKVLKAELNGETQITVIKPNALEELIHLEAPLRSSTKITSLKGSLRITGPTHVETFQLNQIPVGKPIVDKRKDVTVTFSPVKIHPSKWEIEVKIDNHFPLPKFDSHQSWLVNNRIRLETGQGKNQEILLPSQTAETRLAGSATIHYYFYSINRPPAGNPASWKLFYTTPGRIVEYVVPFEFKNLVLP